jgi:nitrogenase cofactor biosynthesis protein NifB
VSAVLSPRGAAERYIRVKKQLPDVRVVGIAGPGDALANYSATAETLKRIRTLDPDVTFCLSTNGLALPDRAGELAELGVTHLTVTINALDPKTGAAIYKWVKYNGRTYTGTAGARLLRDNQAEGLKRAAELGLVCKINTVALRGVNLSEIPELARRVSELGIYIHNIMPHIAVTGSGFEGLPGITARELDALRDECSLHVKQMRHCRQCRADAVGTLNRDRSAEFELAGADNKSSNKCAS